MVSELLISTSTLISFVYVFTGIFWFSLSSFSIQILVCGFSSFDFGLHEESSSDVLFFCIFSDNYLSACFQSSLFLLINSRYWLFPIYASCIAHSDEMSLCCHLLETWAVIQKLSISTIVCILNILDNNHVLSSSPLTSAILISSSPLTSVILISWFHCFRVRPFFR